MNRRTDRQIRIWNGDCTCSNVTKVRTSVGYAAVVTRQSSDLELLASAIYFTNGKIKERFVRYRLKNRWQKIRVTSKINGERSMTHTFVYIMHRKKIERHPWTRVTHDEIRETARCLWSCSIFPSSRFVYTQNCSLCTRDERINQLTDARINDAAVTRFEETARVPRNCRTVRDSRFAKLRSRYIGFACRLYSFRSRQPWRNLGNDGKRTVTGEELGQRLESCAKLRQTWNSDGWSVNK